jgi:hypothetical protein
MLSGCKEWWDVWGGVRGEEQFVRWFKLVSKDSLTGLHDNRPFGCVFLSEIKQGKWAAAQLFKIPGYLQLKEFLPAMREALPRFFERHDLRKLVALVRQRNLPSYLIVRALGFHNDGVLREHAYVNGQWVDYWLMTLFRHELVEEAS